MAIFVKSYQAVGGGTQKYVRNGSVVLPASDLTLEGWFKMGSLPSSGNLFWLWFFNVDSSHRSFFAHLNNTAGVYALNISFYGGSNPSASQAVTVTTGVWTHFAITYNNTTGATKFYVNGVQVGTTQTIGTGGQQGATTEFDIGGRNIANVDTLGFDGYMVNQKLWKEERSGAQVVADMCGFYGMTTNLVGEWSLDNVLTDNSGNGYTLTNNNAGSFVTDAPSVCASARPSVDTDAVTGIDTTSATLNGEITDEGTSTPDEEGFVWGTTTQGDPGDVAPASAGYDDYFTDSGSFGTGVFDHAVTGLSPSTTYYVRAYAHSADGYSYGTEVSFDTDATPPFRFTNLPGVVYDPDDTQTIYAERLNDILERLEALE